MAPLRIPDCCAFPLASKVGDTYVCLTCRTVYRHLIGGWAVACADVDFAPELEDAVKPTLYHGEHPYESTLDEQERHDH